MHANDGAAEPTIHPRWANDDAAASVRTLAEKEPEEREAPAAHLAVRHANRLAAPRGFASLDRNVRNLALVALQRGQDTGIATINVVADLELASGIDKRRLVR